MPQRPREHQLVGKHHRLVKLAVAVRILQPHHTMRRVLDLLLHRRIRARGIGHIQPPLFIERRLNRPHHQRRPGDFFDGEPVRHGEGLFTNLKLSRVGEDCGESQRKKDDRAHDELFHQWSQSQPICRGSFLLYETPSALNLGRGLAPIHFLRDTGGLPWVRPTGGCATQKWP